ncbi:MAG: hypothetical protein ACLU4N_01590 [Butyricimonas faecihominis]
MKWEEIHDRSRMVVDKAMGHLLAEVKDVEEDKDGIVRSYRMRSMEREVRKTEILFRKRCFFTDETSGGEEKACADDYVGG